MSLYNRRWGRGSGKIERGTDTYVIIWMNSLISSILSHLCLFSVVYIVKLHETAHWWTICRVSTILVTSGTGWEIVAHSMYFCLPWFDFPSGHIVYLHIKYYSRHNSTIFLQLLFPMNWVQKIVVRCSLKYDWYTYQILLLYLILLDNMLHTYVIQSISLMPAIAHNSCFMQVWQVLVLLMKGEIFSIEMYVTINFLLN